MKSYILYAVRDIKYRKKSFILIIFSITTVVCIITNFYTMTYGFFKAKLEILPDYHIVLGYLNNEDIDIIQNLDYVSSLYTKDIDGVKHIYVLLEDNNPDKYEYYCEMILNRINAWENYEYYSDSYAYYQATGKMHMTWTNYQYAEYANNSMIGAMFPFFILILLVASIILMLLFNIKIKNSLNDYAVLQSYGMKVRSIININIAELIISQFTGSLFGALLSFGMMNWFAKYTEIILSGDFAKLSYVFPLKEFLLSFAGIFIITNIGLNIMCKRHLKQHIIDIIHGNKMYYISFVSRTSNKFKKSSFYGFLYQIRCRYTIIIQIISAAFLIILPVLFVTIGLVVNVFSDLSPSNKTEYPDLRIARGVTGIVIVEITQDLIDEISAIEGVKYYEADMSEYDGTYDQVLFYITDGLEEEVIARVLNMPITAALRVADLSSEQIYQKAEGNTYAVFFIFQAVILFVCNLFIIYYFYDYNLNERKHELLCLRAIGATKKHIIDILKYDFIAIGISLILGVALGYGAIYTLYMEGNVIAFSPVFMILGILTIFLLFMSMVLLVYNKTVKSIFSKNIAEELNKV